VQLATDIAVVAKKREACLSDQGFGATEITLSVIEQESRTKRQ
jgi:hypothetical protein